MNETLSYILVVLNPMAFIVGGILTAQIWQLRKNGSRNPLCEIMAAILLAYQSRNFITAIAVWWFSTGLVRPTGLLVWSLIGRVIEMAGSVAGVLYFAGKIGNK